MHRFELQGYNELADDSARNACEAEVAALFSKLVLPGALHCLWCACIYWVAGARSDTVLRSQSVLHACMRTACTERVLRVLSVYCVRAGLLDQQHLQGHCHVHATGVGLPLSARTWAYLTLSYKLWGFKDLSVPGSCAMQQVYSSLLRLWCLHQARPGCPARFACLPAQHSAFACLPGDASGAHAGHATKPNCPSALCVCAQAWTWMSTQYSI